MAGPLVVTLELTRSIEQVAVFTSNVNDRVWVDLALELGAVKLRKLLRVDLFLLLFDLVSFFVKLWFFLLGLLRCDVKYAFGSLVADRIAVKNVATVLTIVLVQAPSESFVEQLGRYFLIWVFSQELVYLCFNVKNDERIGVLGLILLIELGQTIEFFLEVVPRVSSLFSRRLVFAFDWLFFSDRLWLFRLVV